MLYKKYQTVFVVQNLLELRYLKKEFDFILNKTEPVQYHPVNDVDNN